MLSERSSPLKASYCIIPFVLQSGKKPVRTETRLVPETARVDWWMTEGHEEIFCASGTVGYLEVAWLHFVVKIYKSLNIKGWILLHISYIVIKNHIFKVTRMTLEMTNENNDTSVAQGERKCGKEK